jgi:hypothetical protein
VTADGDVFVQTDTSYPGTVAVKCYDTKTNATHDDLVVHAPRVKPGKDGKYSLTGSITAPSCGGGHAIENAAVTIRNEKDEVVGATTTTTNVATSGPCKTNFSTTVAKANFYQVKIGTHSGPTYSFDEMQQNGFILTLSLGGN